MQKVINPMTGNVITESFNKVLTFGLTSTETDMLYKSVPTDTAIVDCDNAFQNLLTTPCNCIVFAPSKMTTTQIAQINEIYQDEKRILMLTTEDKKTKFAFPTHQINLKEKAVRKLRSFLESIQSACFSNCDGYMLNDGFVVVDIETTGLDKSKDEIIALSAIKVANMEIVDAWYTLVKPTNPISVYTETFCKISNDMLDSAPNLNTAISELTEHIGIDVFVTYDNGFIEDFLSPIFQKLGYEMRNKPNLNLFRLSRKLYANLLFSKPSRISACAIAMALDTTKFRPTEIEPIVLSDILHHLRNEYGLRSVSDIEKLY